MYVPNRRPGRNVAFDKLLLLSIPERFLTEKHPAVELPISKPLGFPLLIKRMAGDDSMVRADPATVQCKPRLGTLRTGALEIAHRWSCWLAQ